LWPANMEGDHEMSVTEKIEFGFRMIAGLGTIITVITLLIANRKKIKAWGDGRRERAKKLDCLLENVTQIKTTHEALEALIAATKSTSASVQQLAETLEETIEHNKRQDAEIERSREQRRVHDIALFALVDVAKQNGHNGAITQAHEELTSYLREEAHKPVSYTG